MDIIKAVLFEPVGCLAEFQPDEFDHAAADLFGASPDPTASGSQAYWRLLGLIEQQYDAISIEGWVRLVELEMRAIVQVELYEDVRQALEELKTLGVAAYLASSLSRTAVTHFLERYALADLFAGTITRTETSGVMGKPLRAAVALAGLAPAQVMALADTAPALDMIKRLGLNAMLMINDYDEGRALAERNPAGAIVSLAELGDALRLIEQRSGMRAPSRPPLAPYELFDPG